MLDRQRHPRPKSGRSAKTKPTKDAGRHAKLPAPKPEVDPEATTRDRILQAAEALFAEDGFDAVSMRDITTTARVNLASINYHFGSKMALLAEVVASRANVLVEQRLALLDGVVRDRSGKPKLEAAIEAFLRPAFEMSLEPGGVHHMRLRARLAVERVGMTKSQFEQIFDASNQRFIDVLAEALPDCPRTEIYWCFHCLLGVVVYTMASSGRIQHLSDGACDPRDVEAMLARVVPFVAAGFRAIAARA